MKLYAHVGEQVFEFELAEESDHLLITAPSRPYPVALDDRKESIRTATIGGQRVEFGWRRDNGSYLIVIDGVTYEVELRDARAEKAAQVRRAAGATTGEASVKAPIPGRIVKVLVKEGDAVAKDQPLLTLDAMKLENEIASPRAGVVKSLTAQPGMAVERGQVLVVIA
jgi:biotin carboxyl carrier protein